MHLESGLGADLAKISLSSLTVAASLTLTRSPDCILTLAKIGMLPCIKLMAGKRFEAK
jgi:hypothetical protein